MKFAMWDTVKGIFHFLEGGFYTLRRKRADDGEEDEMGTAFDNAVSEWKGFINRVKGYEGYSEHISHGHSGKKTIGYGCRLDEGISESVAHGLLDEQLRECRDDILDTGHVEHVNEARIQALTYMRFHLGYKETVSMKAMWDAIDEGHYNTAADEILNSKMFTDTPKMCKDLANTMRTGAW